MKVTACGSGADAGFGFFDLREGDREGVLRAIERGLVGLDLRAGAVERGRLGGQDDARLVERLLRRGEIGLEDDATIALRAEVLLEAVARLVEGRDLTIELDDLRLELGDLRVERGDVFLALGELRLHSLKLAGELRHARVRRLLVGGCRGADLGDPLRSLFLRRSERARRLLLCGRKRCLGGLLDGGDLLTSLLPESRELGRRLRLELGKLRVAIALGLRDPCVAIAHHLGDPCIAIGLGLSNLRIALALGLSNSCVAIRLNLADLRVTLGLELAHPVSYTHLDVYKRQECVFRKLGIESAGATNQFGNPTGFTGAGGRIRLYRDNDDGNNANGGAVINGSTPRTDTALTNLQANLDQYDAVVFGCPGGENDRSNAIDDRVRAYANKGGRVFATHFNYVYLYDRTPWDTTVTWDSANAQSAGNGANATWVGEINTSPGKRLLFSQWLGGPLVNALSATSPPRITITEPRNNADVPVANGAEEWITYHSDGASGNPQTGTKALLHYTFNTPLNLSLIHIYYEDAGHGVEPRGSDRPGPRERRENYNVGRTRAIETA